MLFGELKTVYKLANQLGGRTELEKHVAPTFQSCVIQVLMLLLDSIP